MYHVDNSTGVPVMPQPSPVTSETELFFTEGGNGVPRRSPVLTGLISFKVS